MTEEERDKLCADLRDPWARTPEELAELAGAAAGEIERLAEELEQERKANAAGVTMRQHYLDRIDDLQKQIEQFESAPASVVRWWARSKRTEGAK
jgi:hypothetical protein